MRLLSKIKEIITRTIAMTMMMCIVMFQLTSNVMFATMDMEENGYVAIITGKLDIYGRVYDINGQINEMQNIPNMHEGVISLLCDTTDIFKNSFVANSVDYYNGNNIYSADKVDFNCNMVTLEGVIVAEHNITVNASNILSEEYTIIYSKSGNININVAEMDFKGLIYAPNGSITINGSNISIDGTMVAKNVNLYVDAFIINANQFSDSMVNILKTYRNDKLLTLTAYTYEDDIVVGFESDVAYEQVDIYVRNDNSTKFTYLTSTTESEYTISEYDFEQCMDIMAVANTKYGDSFDSTLISVGYSNDENAEKLASYSNDTDEDGIMDGLEVWYSKSNPYNADSDSDGFNDYVECFYLYTDPNVRNENRDSDDDGVNDLEEVVVGTNPYLSDTDFDGYTDDKDITPLKYNEGSELKINYTENKIIGIFDKVSTWIDDNGNVYQYIYNFLNDNVQYTMMNGVITKYYYDIANRLVAVVTINDDVVDSVTYTYEGNVLNSVAYNGFLYEFEVTENEEKVTIAGNTYRNVLYGEDELVTSYGNGFEVKNLFNEYGDSTEIYYNGEIAFKCVYDEKGQPGKIIDYISGNEQTYTYMDDGNIDVITGKDYSISYEYSDEKYVIEYDINGGKYSQIIFNDIEDKYASQYSSILVSGALHENIEMGDGDIQYKITKDGQIIFSNLLTYTGSTVTGIEYNNGDEFTYEYTSDGKLSNILKNGNIVIKYYYDNLGRVVREDNILAGICYEFRYNEDNNMIEKKQYGYTSGEFVECITEEIYAYDSLWKDKLTDISGMKITYDEVGNAVSYRDGMEFEWAGRTLIGVNGTQNIVYKYNHEGIRTAKIVDGVETEYIIEGKDIVFEVTDGNVKTYIYDSDMNVIGMIYNGEVYYYEKNVQGDVIRILDENANVLCEYVYDAWGNIVLVEGNCDLAKENPFRYRSYYQDCETDLYYVESRYYDPQTGRFINADKIEAVVWDYTNLNMYVYCNNDPVNMYDPSGEDALTVKSFISRDLYGGLDNDNWIEHSQNLIGCISAWRSQKNISGSHKLYVIDDKNEFIKVWNESIINVSTVVIMGHGTPNSILFSDVKSSEAKKNPDKYNLYTEDIYEEMKKKQIKFVWLLSCNTGHYDLKTSNIAYVLASKVTGVVIAPDGIVAYRSGSNYFNTCVVHDLTWFSYREEDSYVDDRYYGWLLYKEWTTPRVLPFYRTTYNHNRDNVYLNTLDIYDLAQHLVDNKYFSYK